MARELKRRRRSTAPVEEPNTTASDEEEEETAPRRRTRRAVHAEEEEPQPKPKVAKGWGATENLKGGGDFANEFRVSDTPVPIKFLEDEPFAVFYQHWIERSGKKSWRCLEQKCPLCDDLGDKASAKVGFNIVSLEDPEKPEVCIWYVGKKVADLIKAKHKDKKTGPLSREDMYFVVQRTGKKGSYQTSLESLKARDLDEDWDVQPFTEDELDEFFEDAADEDAVEFHTKSKLQEIADEALGG